MPDRPRPRTEATQARILMHRDQHPADPLVAAADRNSRKLQYESLIAGFDRSGGVVTGNELAALLQRHSGQAVSTVARWIVTRTALSFPWEAKTLVPLFQFELSTLQLREGMAHVLPELLDILDDWELARWFSNPNPWLGDIAPADLLATRPDLVRDAARVDRSIARP